MARRVYPVYTSIAKAFRLTDPPIASLEELKEGSEPEALRVVEAWVDELDKQVKAHHLRHILQNDDVTAVEQTLGYLSERYLKKAARTDADRDKLDFLLAQYVAVCAPPSFHRRKLELDDVGEILEAVIGPSADDDLTLPAQLEELVAATPGMTSMRGFVDSRIIERGRALKVAAGDRYFAPGALVAFTRFNYVVRRTYLRLMDVELQAVAANLKKLTELGVETVDCRGIGLDVQPVAKLQELVAGWKRPRLTDYSNDQPFVQAMELRGITDAAVAAADPQQQIRELRQQVAELLAQFQQVSREVEALRREHRESAAAPAVSKPAPPIPSVPAPAPASPSPANAPAATPAPPPAASSPAPAPPTTAAAPPAPLDPAAAEELIVEFTERITNEISSKASKKAGGRARSITIGNQALLLTEAEIAAFENPASDEVGLRRCVAVRAILIASVESRGRDAMPMRNAVALGQAELARAEKAEAAASGDAKAAMATSRARLAAVVRHAATQARSS